MPKIVVTSQVIISAHYYNGGSFEEDTVTPQRSEILSIGSSPEQVLQSGAELFSEASEAALASFRSSVRARVEAVSTDE